LFDRKFCSCWNVGCCLNCSSPPALISSYVWGSILTTGKRTSSTSIRARGFEYETMILCGTAAAWRDSRGNECLIIRFGAGLYGNHCSTIIGPLTKIKLIYYIEKWNKNIRGLGGKSG
jgi:hypothetical protein